MPSQYEQPGASIEEQAAASRSISGVPSSITAFIGRAPRGPVDEPVSVISSVEYDGVFGGLWTESALGHSVHDFFRQGGTTAIIVRVHQGVADDTASNLGRVRDRPVITGGSLTWHLGRPAVGGGR